MTFASIIDNWVHSRHLSLIQGGANLLQGAVLLFKPHLVAPNLKLSIIHIDNRQSTTGWLIVGVLLISQGLHYVAAGLSNDRTFFRNSVFNRFTTMFLIGTLWFTSDQLPAIVFYTSVFDVVLALGTYIIEEQALRSSSRETAEKWKGETVTSRKG